MMNSKTLMGPLGISLASIIIVMIVVFSQVSPIIAAVIHPGSSNDDGNKRIKELLTASVEETSLYSDRFNGRSAFFTPPAPPPLPPSTSNSTYEKPVQRKVGPAKTYGGSLKSPNCILVNTVYFQSGSSVSKLKVGETKSGVRIVSVHAPYYVKVAWTKPATPTELFEEGTYDLYLFDVTDTGPNSPLPSSPPKGGNRFEGLESAPNLPPTGAVDPRERLDPRRRARNATTYDDEEDDDGEDDVN